MAPAASSSSSFRRYSTRTSPTTTFVKQEDRSFSHPSEDGSLTQLSLEHLDLSSSSTRTPFSPSGSDDSQLPTTSLRVVGSEDYDDTEFVVGGMADGARKAGGGKAPSSAKNAAQSKRQAHQPASAKRGSVTSEIEGGEDDDDDEDDGKLGRKTSLRTRNRLKQRLHRERRARHLETLESQISLVPQLQAQVGQLESTLSQTQLSLQNATTQLAASGAQMHAYEALIRDMQGRELQREQMIRWMEAEVLKLRSQVGGPHPDEGQQQGGQPGQSSSSAQEDEPNQLGGKRDAQTGVQEGDANVHAGGPNGEGSQDSRLAGEFAGQAGPTVGSAEGEPDREKDWNTLTPTVGRALDMPWYMGGGPTGDSDGMAPSPSFSFPPFPFPQQPPFYFGGPQPPQPMQNHQHQHLHFGGPPPPSAAPHGHHHHHHHHGPPHPPPPPAPQQFAPQPYSSPYGSPPPHLLPPHLRPQVQTQPSQRANLPLIDTSPPTSQVSILPTPMMTAAIKSGSTAASASTSDATNGTAPSSQPAMSQYGYPAGGSNVYSSYTNHYTYPAQPQPQPSTSSASTTTSTASQPAPPPPRPILTLASPNSTSSPSAVPSPPASTAPPNPLLSTLPPLQTHFHATSSSSTSQAQQQPTLALSPVAPSPISTFSYTYTTGATPGGMMMGTPTQHWGYGGGLSAGGWGTGAQGMWPWATMGGPGGGGSGMSPITPGGGMMMGISPLDGPRADGGRPF